MSSDPESNIEARLCAYIDGLLDAEQRDAIEQYLDRYPEHRQLIDQLMQERALLRDLPRESAPPDVLAHFQGQLERSVLLGDLETDSARSARDRRRGRWNLAVLLAFLLLALGVSVIVWIAMPPNRVHQPAATLMMPEPVTTMPVDTTQSSTTEPAAEPATEPVRFEEVHSRAALFDVADSNLIVVTITSADIPADQARVDAFLSYRGLHHPLHTQDLSITTQPTATAQQAWEVPGMTHQQAQELVEWVLHPPKTDEFGIESNLQPSTMPIIATTQAMDATRPATNPTTTPAGDVMIIFENPDLPATQPVRDK